MYLTQTPQYYSKISGDFSNTCLLECPGCLRQNPHFDGVKLSNISVDDFSKICETFKVITCNGRASDIMYHPKFHYLMNVALENDVTLELHINGHGKNETWWKKTYEISQSFSHDKLKFVFALDGLPKDSNRYRINQDGENVFEMMKLGVEYGANIQWQYIIFDYNENDIETAKQMAKDNKIDFLLIKSSKWFWEEAETYQPSQNNCLTNFNIFDDNDESGFYPRCLHGELNPFYSSDGYVLPCCYLFSENVEELEKEHLKIKNVDDIVTEVCNSKEWYSFFDKLKSGKDIPDICKRTCYKRESPIKDKRLFKHDKSSN